MSEFPESPEAPERATVPPSVVATTVVPGVARAAPPTPPLGVLVFFGVLALLLLSFGSALLVFAGATRPAASARATSTPVVARSASPTSAPGSAAPAASVARVLGATANTQAAGGGNYTVTFVWMLTGANVGDPVVLRFFAGSRQVSEVQGTLDQNVYSQATGRLTVPTAQVCSTEGWSAEIVSLRNQPVTGDPVAKAAAVAC